jgi:hypothetical protein
LVVESDVPAGLLIGVFLAQAATPSLSPSADLERIRAALGGTPAIFVPSPVPRDGFVFRVTVHAPPPARPMWDDWSSVPSYIRPNMGLYQYEYFQLVTPEQFRGGTFNTVSIPIGPLLELLGKHIATVHRKTKEEKAQEEVRQALAEVIACRVDPARPGC